MIWKKYVADRLFKAWKENKGKDIKPYFNLFTRYVLFQNTSGSNFYAYALYTKVKEFYNKIHIQIFKGETPHSLFKLFLTEIQDEKPFQSNS